MVKWTMYTLVNLDTTPFPPPHTPANIQHSNQHDNTKYIEMCLNSFKGNEINAVEQALYLHGALGSNRFPHCTWSKFSHLDVMDE